MFQSHSTPIERGIYPNSLSLNRSSWALSRTRVGACSLAAQRKTTSVANTAITAKIHQAFDVHRDFAAEVALDNQICDNRSQTGNFGFRQILHRRIRLNVGRSTDLPRSRGANAIDRRQPNHDVLVQRNVYACYSSHFVPFPVILALTLLMTFVSTNHPHNTVAPNDLAVSTHFSN